MMRVHFKVHGPLDWQCEAIDMDTGQRLPVMLDGLHLEVRDGRWVLVGALDIEQATVDGVTLVAPGIGGQ